MSPNNEPYREDTADASTEEPYDERDTGAFPYTWAPWGGRWGLRRFYGSRPEDAVDDERAADETYVESDDSWLGEGLIGFLLVVGVVLFLFPEPATSALGIILIIIGVVGWIIDAVTG